jgi:hypothetical protein
MSTSNFQQLRSVGGGAAGGGRRQPFGFLDDNTLVSSSSASKSKRNSFASAASATSTLAGHPSDDIVKLKKKNVVMHAPSSVVTRSQARGMKFSAPSLSLSSSSSRSKDDEEGYPTKKKKSTRFVLAKDDDGNDDYDCRRSSSTESPTDSVNEPSSATLLTKSTKQTVVVLPYTQLAINNSEFVPFEDGASIFRQPMAASPDDDNADDFWGNGMEDMLTLRRANPITSEDGDIKDDRDDDSSTDEGWQEMVDVFKSLAEDLLLDEIGSEAAEGGEPIYYSSRLAEDDQFGFIIHHSI